jgi:DNA-binding beta-propeller fold protein YncE
MRVCLVFVSAVLLAACAGAPSRREAAAVRSALGRLDARFYSRAAAAHLEWGSVPAARFLRYEIRRHRGAESSTVAVLTAATDTVYVDSGLQADQLYRYQVAAFLGEGGVERALYTPVAVGAIHPFARSWSTASDGEPFLPVRLAVDSRGTVYATGARSGRVARFGRTGEPLGHLVFTREPVACLAPGALDGPALALDSGDNLHVVYNVRRQDQRPQAFWSKFTSAGVLAWSRPLEGRFARHITIDASDRVFIESISQLQQCTVDGELVQTLPVPAQLVSSLRAWGGRLAALIEPLGRAEPGWQAPRLVLYDGLDRKTCALVIGRDAVSAQDQAGGLLVRPTDFAVAADSSRTFVVNAGLDRIEVFAQEAFVTRWGRSGEGPGEFDFVGPVGVVDDIATGRVVEREVQAGGIACDAGGYVLVADTFNDRIQAFQP